MFMLDAELDNIKKQILTTYNLSLLCESNDEKTEYLNMMEDLLEIKNEYEFDKRSLEKAKSKTTVAELDAFYKNELKKKKIYHTKKSVEYKNFQADLENMDRETKSMFAEDEGEEAKESEEIVIEADVNIFDPLTKLPMQDPVRNRTCGHHYEKSTILKSLEVNPRLRCPVAGCGNQQYLKPGDLIDDHRFKILLTQYSQLKTM